MEVLPVLISITLVILVIVLSVVGVQLVLVLNEVRRTLVRVNATLDEAELRFNQVVQPLQGLGGMGAGLKTGLKVFETFVGWLQRHKES